MQHGNSRDSGKIAVKLAHIEADEVLTVVDGHLTSQGWSPTFPKMVTHHPQDYCHTRLHLGFSANLRIWQVPACKMEPQRGIILTKPPATRRTPFSNRSNDYWEPVLMCGVPPYWPPVQKVCAVSPPPYWHPVQKICEVSPPPGIHFFCAVSPPI